MWAFTSHAQLPNTLPGDTHDVNRTRWHHSHAKPTLARSAPILADFEVSKRLERLDAAGVRGEGGVAEALALLLGVRLEA